jgi:hypothetical protein
VNADQIARQLEKVSSEAEGNHLHNECHARVAQIRERIQQIAPGHPLNGNPSERERAILKGEVAMKALDEEIESLNRECDRLSALAGKCLAAGQDADRQRQRAEIPKAARYVPGAVSAVHAALEQLDKAIAALNSHVELIARHGEFAIPCPIDVETQRAVLSCREAVWTVRHVKAMAPTLSGSNDFLRHPQYFDLSRLAHVTADTWIADDIAYTVRRGPKAAEPVVQVPEGFITRREKGRRAA